MPMSVDGPYGDRDTASTLASHDKVLLIAGGSGVGYLLGVLEGVLKEVGNVKDMRMVMAVRHSSTAAWILETIKSILAESKKEVKVELHVTESITSAADPASTSSTEDIEKVATKTSIRLASSHPGITIIQGRGRPDLKELIRGATSEGNETVGIAACGPSSMMLEVGNACADAQRRILRGGSGARGVWLHTEAFSW
jgi:ferredoxin-NADP reductase